MRPPRLLLLIFCFIFLPILLTFLSLVTAEPRRSVDADAPIAGRSNRLRALFSFNAPTSLFPPSAIISLTDDNSTFFLARPAAFGPLLPTKGLSGPLWIGRGFSEDTLRRGAGTAETEGELGCSDVPGWDQDGQSKQDKGLKESALLSGTGSPSDQTSVKDRRASDASHDTPEKSAGLVSNDGTDDHLHRPLVPSHLEKEGDKPTPAHADIQSLQESAEIAGKIVLLSRGGCGFLEKVMWVQRRGGTALIVGDDTKGGSLVTMYARGDTSNVTIPAIFTSYTTAHLLSSLVTERTVLERQSDFVAKIPPKKQQQDTVATTTSKSTSAPTSTNQAKGSLKTGPSGGGFFSSFLSKIWLRSDQGVISEDSRRPPSSGGIDWVVIEDWDEEEYSNESKGSGSAKNRAKKTEKAVEDSATHLVDGDGFEIGVHDWRDPDLVLPKTTSKAGSNSADEKRKPEKIDDKVDNSKNSNLKGGSITPGSGEYTYARKPTEAEINSKKASKNGGKSSKSQLNSVEERWWFARLFGWNHAADRSMKSHLHSLNNVKGSTLGEERLILNDHDGLWVTLTPTTMSTNPFFDTLLVLVVSPLITLTVVYALLLLRSRIRRRRWRAPKSVVERLPIRTYHTITSQSTTTSSSPRSPSPGSVASFTSTSPLLSSGPLDTLSRSRPRSQTVSGTIIKTDTLSPSTEKSNASSSLWRRKYIGRQVECVVCLEEYVDGQSQVMSLPCGHEFHAECITPWLTTRRRTCPICKGDVVRSMAQRDSGSESRVQNGEPSVETRTSAVPILANTVDDSTLEDGEGPDAPLLSGNNLASSAPHSSWRNFASMSFSALSGDTIWHSARADRSR
ncbi:hypothetical protein BGW36DRAFT_303132 [Talaromyces proteolyticus]|uniref:RING-type E3 ubiquitin transferase n=1 Tax=Talaromyces proteolyticus TaxID=1131652 RepID=A0AAD4KQ13_9EURO|nr:uncharacterized protein BGW36DRAFT_303132 [Talaromyces proteolyticus]KAH8692949.1 hypothetical protein BGW36DRAFT_303132 [Talaromyces proteolyticus]